MGAGWRPLLVAVGEPPNPHYEVSELSGHRGEAGAPMGPSAGNVPMVSDRPPRRPGLAGCVGRAVQLGADRWAKAELLSTFGKPTQDELTGVADDR